MIPSPPKSRFTPEPSVRVIQHVRVGHRRWTTELTGTVEAEGVRPVGGMEMGGKAMYCRQDNDPAPQSRTARSPWSRSTRTPKSSPLDGTRPRTCPS